jgi:hypothetical protein
VFTSMGKERHHHDDGSLGRPVEAEPHDGDRGDADDGQRADQVPDGEEPAAQEIDAVDEDGDEEAGEAADRVAYKHGFEKGLAEVGGERGDGGDEARPYRARRRQQHGWHAEAAHQDFPQDQQPEAEDERDQQRQNSPG